MNINFKFYIFLFSFFFITNPFLKPINANEHENRVKEAISFMIGGDGGREIFLLSMNFKVVMLPIIKCKWGSN